MLDLKNSEGSPRSKVTLIGAMALLALIGASAAHWCLARGYVLYYGDAEAHLNIARRILDSRTPGLEQIGTVWLPLPHLLMVPFVMRDEWWRSGLAGIIPGVACFVLAGVFLFAAARRIFASDYAALAVMLLFALNPNMLYLQSTPMTEPVFQASFAALLWASLWFRDSQTAWAVLAAAAASNAASLTRYEGWFLIPFVCLYFLLMAKRKWLAVLFGALAMLAPLAWLALNHYYEGNALEFYSGPYSAMAIYRRYLTHGLPYPGDHNWTVALTYYFAAARWVIGWPLIGIGIAGTLAAFWQPGLWKKIWWPLFFAALVPVFYIWSIHSSGTPIFVPELWPNGWYNTRYALGFLPLIALAGGALVILTRSRLRLPVALALAAIPAAIWAATGAPAITWKEAEVNSIARRAWTTEAAKFLAANYEPGFGIIFEFGDLAGVLREAGIPLREGFHQGNRLAWVAAVIRPDLFLDTGWALAISGDEVSTAMLRADRHGQHYELRKQIIVKGAPVVEIYQRQ